MGTALYAAKKQVSQDTTSYYYQPNYAYFCAYFGAVVIFIFVLKRIAFKALDDSSKKSNDRSNKWKSLMYQLSAFSRYFSYRRFPKMLCDLFQLPSSFGNFMLICVMILFTLCYAFVPKPWYRECRGFGSPPLAVRTGLMSTMLVPFILILSGKTNLISQLTGISYEKLNVYHRWVSVLCCFLGWVHTIPFYIQFTNEGGTERISYFMTAGSLYVNGIPPLVFLTVLTIFSHSYIRAMWYELWLDIHWICALGFYISLYIHVYKLIDGWKYLSAAIVFWGLQLVWRGMAKNFFKLNKGFLKKSPCTMRRLPSTENDHYFEICVENNSDVIWTPGQHVFLRIPGLRFLENHPFSILSHYEPFAENELKFIVKTGGWQGLTSMIYDKLPMQGYEPSHVFVDGPYGGAERDVESFDNVYLLASGTGVTAITAFLFECIEKFESKQAIVKTVRMDWVVRQSDNVDWIKPELKRALAKYNALVEGGSIDINIYVTNDDGMDAKDVQGFLSESEDEKNETLKETTSVVHIHNDKPDFQSIVEKKIGRELGRRNMFVVSGSDSMRNAVSNSVANLQSRVMASANIDEVYLHSESFGW